VHLQTSICSSICGSQTGAGDEDMRVLARRQLRDLNDQQVLLLVTLAQDCADALIAMQDVVGKKITVASPTTVAICGLISACASIWKNWPQEIRRKG
jgi:Peroxisomal biogenesis factor 11 (PEX11)